MDSDTAIVRLLDRKKRPFENRQIAAFWPGMSMEKLRMKICESPVTMFCFSRRRKV
jgi:hypothetical protein